MFNDQIISFLENSFKTRPNGNLDFNWRMQQEEIYYANVVYCRRLSFARTVKKLKFFIIVLWVALKTS